MVIFLWKISPGLVSGYDVQFTSGGLRRGRLIVPNTVLNGAPAMVRNAIEHSLGVRGAIRTINTEHVELFKNHLDVFLSSIPDQPTMTGLGRAAETNSILHQLPMFYSQTR